MSLPMFVRPITLPLPERQTVITITSPLAVTIATPGGVVDPQTSVSETTNTNLRKFLHHARTVVKGFLAMSQSKMTG